MSKEASYVKGDFFYIKKVTPFYGADSAGWWKIKFPFRVTDVLIKAEHDCLISFGIWGLGDLFHTKGNMIFCISHKKIGSAFRIPPQLTEIQIKAEEKCKVKSRNKVEVFGYIGEKIPECMRYKRHEDLRWDKTKVCPCPPESCIVFTEIKSKLEEALK